MKRTTFTLFAFAICFSSASLIAAQSPPAAPAAPAAPGVAPGVPPPPPAKNPLVWDAMEKEYLGKPGDTTNAFTFWVTNTGPKDVLINNVVPACGCTVAQMPSTPWKLAPGASGPIVATMNFAGKTGDLSKTMSVISSVGQQTLTMRINVPRDEDVERRQRNMLIALQDVQSVFRNDCASCHVKNGEGKKGHELFVADCAICHDPPAPGHRSPIVTDLKQINHPTDAAFWRSIIADGKKGTLMPAFAKSKEGPLDDEQIDSLVEYCMKTFPSRFTATDKAVGTDKPVGTVKPGGTQ